MLQSSYLPSPVGREVTPSSWVGCRRCCCWWPWPPLWQ